MRILILNGSPRSGASNTMKLTMAFLQGLQSFQNVVKHETETIEINKVNIEPCRGCFCCWEKTPGKCCITDDMAELFQKYINAELVIWSFPLYYFGLPSKLKAFMDRLLPINLPYITELASDKARHPARYDLSTQRHIIISTCGFFTIENNYDALIKQFDIMFKDRYTKILCPQGETFKRPELKERTDEYLELVKQAGAEYFFTGRFSEDTTKQLAVPLFQTDAFLKMANANWQITVDDNEKNAASQKSSPQQSQAEKLLRQMSAIYQSVENAPKDEKHIEFFFTDTNEIYQLRVSNNSSVFVKDTAEFSPYSLRIETSFEQWQDISLGKISGTEALSLRKYRVLGDFSLMTSIMGGFTLRKKNGVVLQKKRSMVVLLLPFLVLWVLLPIFGNVGAFTAVMISACIPFFTKFFRLSPYDTIGAFFVSALSVVFLAGVSSVIVVTGSYLLFSSLWLVSIFYRIPLCAWYSSNNFGGDNAFDNPLFIRTNRIITVVWGTLYLFVGGFTWFFMQTGFAPFIGLINSIAPAVAGIFTLIFAKWYPAQYARNICR